MREILPVAAEWVRRRRPFAIATVVGVAGSAPREIGASMIVSADGAVVGNVSGGCVEGVVYERCLEVIATGLPVVEEFGYGDADGLSVGLTCGGAVDVLVRAVLPDSAPASDIAVLAQREQDADAIRYTLVTSGPRLGRGVIDGRPPTGEEPSERTITIELGRPARLVIVGAVEFAVALNRLAVAMGMRVSVVDPRSVFAVPERFPGAEVVVDWPDRYLAAHPADASTAVCVLSHDPKLDVPALTAALASRAGYVGAMGSRRTDADRRRRLGEAAVSPAAMLRLRSPIGLDLGGRSPEETALSILAEIVADRHGGSGQRISQRTGAIHGSSAASSGAAQAGGRVGAGDGAGVGGRVGVTDGVATTDRFSGGDRVTGGDEAGSAAPESAAECAWMSDVAPTALTRKSRIPEADSLAPRRGSATEEP